MRYEEVPFDLLADLAPPPRRELSEREKDKAAQPRWWRYAAVQRAHCYVCLQARLDGKDVPPRRAAWVRSHEGQDVLYCVDHAVYQRGLEDGVLE